MSRLFSFLATTAPAVPQPGRLLRKLLDGAQAVAAREVEHFRYRLADALLKLSETTNVPAEEQASFDAYNHLRKDGEKLCAAFIAALEQHCSAAVRALEEGRQDAAPAFAADLDGAQDKFLLDEVAQSLERQSGDALAILNCSLGALLAREGLATAHNPWRPQVFLGAFYRAWSAIDGERASRRVVLGLIGPQLFPRLDAVYAGLNALLAESGFAPDPKALARARRAATQAAEPPRRSPPMLFAATTSPALRVREERYYRVRDWLLGGSRPASAEPQGDMADLNLPDLFAEPDTTGKLQANTISVAVAPQLFGHLTRLQQKLEKSLRIAQPAGADILRHIGRGLPPGVLSPVDANTLELMERVFEHLLHAPEVSPLAKPLLARLQIPLLKAALMDRKFFINSTHPAHRLLDLAVSCGAGWDDTGREDALCLALKRAVDRIASEFDQDLSVFEEVSAELETLQQEEYNQAQAALADCIAQATRAEKLYRAEQAARADILERLEAGLVPYSLENFLQTQWLRVLTLAHAGERKKPEVLQRALAVMDDLLWSVQAKANNAERRELLQRLPDILARLNTWLDAIKWSGPERNGFFAALAQQHATLVRPQREDNKAKLESALAQARRASERGMFGARRKPAPGARNAAGPLENLCLGDWLEWHEEDGKRRCLRLAWISPERSQFVLAGRRAAHKLLCSELELEHRLQQGRALLLKVEGAFGRALDAVLAGPAPTQAERR